MSAGCANLSTPIDEGTAALLSALLDAAKGEGVPALLIGAFARDLQFLHRHGIRPGRRTHDIDIAVAVREWDQYQRLVASLLATRLFETSPGQAQRLVYRETRPVDIIPFGEVADSNGDIHWPGGTASMAVIGFADALEHAQSVRFCHDGRQWLLPVVSVPGLMLLKLLSWQDRPSERRRDAEDMTFIIQHCLAAGNQDRVLTGRDRDISAETPHDTDTMAARLLGRDIARLASARPRQRVLDLLERECVGGHCPLCQELRRYWGGDFRRAQGILKALHQGLAEERPEPGA